MLIENIKLNKEKYYYWLDDNINLLFEIKSTKENNINNIICNYWCNFYWDKYKTQQFEEKIILEENNNYYTWEVKKYNINIPLKLPNFNKDDFKSENYIKISINKKFSIFDIKKIIFPKIILDNNILWLENFNNKNHSKDYYERKIEDLIIKDNEKEYINIQSDITKIKKSITKIYSNKKKKIKEWKELEYNEKNNKLLILLNEKNKLFKLVNENDRTKLDNLYKNLSKQYNKEESKLILENIYKLYKVKNINSYNNLIKLYLNKYFNNIKEINYTKNIKNKQKNKLIESDYIYIKWFKRLIRNKPIDLIHKDIYSEFKKNFIFYIYDKLINSKVYNFFYRYAILFIIFSYVQTLIIRTNNEYYLYLILILFLIFTSSLLFWLLLMKIIKIIINKNIYNYKLHKEKDISNNIIDKFKNWNLLLSDIFKNFDIKVWNEIDYNLKLTLSLYFQWVNIDYSRKWWSVNYYNQKIYEILLFSNNWKWRFNYSKIEALKNNYNKLIKILPNSNNKNYAKIYYKIKFSFKSSYLPDIKENFNNLMLFRR